MRLALQYNIAKMTVCTSMYKTKMNKPCINFCNLRLTATVSKNIPGVKKGEAKSEGPKVILFIYLTKKVDMQVEAKACITDRIV